MGQPSVNRRSEFDIAYEYGHQGELLVADVLDQLAHGQASIEVKRSSHSDQELYIEYEQNKGNRGVWENSGIRVTTAEYWAFVKPGGIITFVPTEVLRKACRLTYAVPDRRKETIQSGNPTRGLLIPVSALFKLARD